MTYRRVLREKGILDRLEMNVLAAWAKVKSFVFNGLADSMLRFS